ncbi:hypothetical protein ALC53_14253 [Atta colombica]|uniref:Uncharacterized protein n=1 Tax=Atta colombica TaxID=520822 RepID=A0A195ATK9_9HYME|nr:hypothetical protein ALC53_14253 [Atta colombica]
MLGDALCASGERIESREKSTDDVVDDAYYRHPKQEGSWSTISLLRGSNKPLKFRNLPFVVSSQRCQLPPILFSSAMVVAVSMEMCVQNLYPRRSPELPGNSRKALVELRATKERLRCESFPIPPFLYESRTGAMYPGLQVQENEETNFPKKMPGRYCNNKLLNVCSVISISNKNNMKSVEIENAGEKKKNRKTREKNPVMNEGCSRFNEFPRWSSMENKENLRGKRSRKLEMFAKKRKEKEKPVFATDTANQMRSNVDPTRFLRFTKQTIRQHVMYSCLFPNQEECLPRTRRWLFGRMENKSTSFCERCNEMPPARFQFRKPCNLKVDLYRFGINGSGTTTENGDEDQLTGFLLHDLLHAASILAQKRNTAGSKFYSAVYTYAESRWSTHTHTHTHTHTYI